MSHESKRHRRNQEHSDLGRGRKRDLRCEANLAAVGDDDSASVLGGVAHDRDDDRSDEEVAHSGLLGEDLERANEDLGDEGGCDGRDSEGDERIRERPTLDLVVTRDVHRPVPPERVTGRHEVDDEKRNRDRNREVDDEITVRIAVPTGDRGDEEEENRHADQGERQEARRAVDLTPPAGHERKAEDEQKVADDRSGQRATDDLGESLIHRQQRDDQLRGVAERGVEEAADSRARVLGGVLGRLTDDPGKRDESDRGEDELHRLGKICGVVEDDHHGRQEKPGEENASHHSCVSLPARRSSSRLWRRASTCPRRRRQVLRNAGRSCHHSRR